MTVGSDTDYDFENELNIWLLYVGSERGYDLENSLKIEFFSNFGENRCIRKLLVSAV